MISVFTATILCGALLYALRGGVTAGGPVSFSGFNGIGVVVVFVAFVFSAALLGPAFGISLLISLFIHELGHVLAYRMLGHTNTRIRMVPLLRGSEISDRPLTSEGQAFFVAIMGSGLSLAPMVLALALSAAFAQTAPEFSVAMRVFSVTCGALNFVNLLPIWPLDGGRCARLAAASFWPALAPGMTIFMCSAMAMAGLRSGSIALLILAAIGAQSLWRKNEPLAEPMSANHALIALAAYAFTFAAHFTSGWLLLQIYF
ncbi:MAG: hypothetical protein KUG69_04670 [Marinosulfonomonas sp.]|nr:hypothetical protein [Marinosulfonomonas sp.]